MALPVIVLLITLMIPPLAEGRGPYHYRHTHYRVKEAVSKIPYRPKWVSVMKKGHLFQYGRREFSSPRVEGDLIFIGSDSQSFYAIRKGSGRKVWRFRSHGSVNSTPSFSGGSVFFGDDEGYLYALDLKTGKKRWEQDLGSEILTPPAASSGALYVATVEGRVVSLNPEDGSLLWEVSHALPDDLRMTIRGNSPPLLDDQGNLYVGFSDGLFWCLRAKTGKPVWQVTLGSRTLGSRTLGSMTLGSMTLPTSIGFRDIDGTPSIDKERIYLTTWEGPLVALSRKNGRVLWSYPAGSAVALISNGDLLYLSDSNGSLHAIDKKEGKGLWQTKVGEGALTAPVVYRDRLAVGLSSSTMNFLNATNGKLIARRFARKGISSHPLLDGDRLYYFSNGGRLYSLKMVD